ncbi:ABC transporter substrate-binding protein [Roseococcus sp.]|uniref:ABC transporter substrate-binding protein n=1 Tax=Roseococcus sp. TaxID=2109646 RepID=UPI003BAD8963
MTRNIRQAWPAALLAGALALAPGGAEAQGTNQNLTIGVGGAFTTMDPHFYNASPNASLSSHVFEPLVVRDARAALTPGLAESWRTISDTVWEFRLRAGVKWHDGRDLTADDVAFTIARVPNVPNTAGSFGGYVRAISRVEVVNPLTVRIHTASPHPLLTVELGSIFIVSRHVGEGAATEDYNSGRAAIGTGPYRLVSYSQGDRVVMERNGQHWDRPQPWARVNYRMIGNDAARSAALLSGDVDVIDQVPSSDLARLRRDPRVTISEIESLRMIHVAPDWSRRENPIFVSDTAGRPLATNPFLDARVRRALNIAINRTALAERVMEGTAVPNGQWLPPGLATYNPNVPVPPFDPEAARRLLAEAGFPQGFRLTLHTPNDRYPNDSRVAQAVAQMWTRIGVQTSIEALPWSTFSTRASRQEFGMRLTGWGSSTGEASIALANVYGTYDRAARTGSANSGRYSNPALDALVRRAVSTVDDARREEMLREAVKMTMEDDASFVLFQLVNFWAVRKGLTYEPRMDERTVAMSVRPSAP